MKNIVVNKISRYLFISLLFPVFYACEYKDVFDAEYPDEQVYITGVYESIIYKLDEIIEEENAPFRYKIDSENNKLVIPLGIYRAYVNSKTNISVKLEVDNDTIPGLIEWEEFQIGEDELLPEILPSNSYELDEEVQIRKGEEVGIFHLNVDIPFLLANSDKRFALGIKMSEANALISETMNLIVVDILAAFVEAHPDFTFDMGNRDPLEVTFINNSRFCLDYEWDFGDGSPTVKEESGTFKHTFPDVGIYNVKLTSKGTRGNLVTTTKVIHIWEDVTADYLKNTGDPFNKVGLVSGRVDVLEDWECTPNVFSTYNSANDIYIGGYQGDNGGVMDFYANAATGGALENAKIYQQTNIPAGPYYAAFIPFDFVGVNDCYLVVTKSDVLPDINDIASDPNVLGYFNWNEKLEETKHGVEFDMPTAGNVTIGFVVSNESGSRVKIRSVYLSK